MLDRLGRCEVVTDPDPDARLASPFRTYLACLTATPPEATHRLIVQDDAWPCSDFRARAEEAILRHPDALTALFVSPQGLPGEAARFAVKRALSEARIPIGFAPTVALAWPQEAVQSFLSYATRYEAKPPRGDDGPVGAWRRETRWECYAPIPSLVQHPDVEPSLFRGRPGSAGANKARVAVSFIEG